MSTVHPGRTWMRAIALALAVIATPAWAEPPLTDAMRGATAIPETTRPPLLGNAVNNDARVPRSYDMQPPIIPHRVDGYQIDRNFNKCLDCHSRSRTDVSQAVPVSATHYIDRGGKVLAQISTRRYFCMQCHVAQEHVGPLVGNSFRGDPSAGRAAAPASLAAPKP